MRFPWQTPASPSKAPRRSQRMGFTWDSLEERKVLSHFGGFHHLHGVAQVTSVSSTATTTSASTASSTTAPVDLDGDDDSSSSSNSALSTALKTLQTDVQKILSASGTTVGQLSAIQTTFQALRADGLKPTSQSALSSFENSLVTAFASGTTLTSNATLLTQFEALYTSTPSTLTTQQTTDLTAAYNALAAAVTSSNVTSANISTINTDFAAVLAAENSASTATYPYFNLVTGGHIRHQGFGHHEFGDR